MTECPRVQSLGRRDRDTDRERYTEWQMVRDINSEKKGSYKETETD